MPALEAVEAKDGKEAKEAKEAKDPVDVLKISGLGEAINVAVATAAAVTKDNLATISKIETEYPDMPVSIGTSPGIGRIYRRMLNLTMVPSMNMI